MQANLVDYYYENISRIYQRVQHLLDIVNNVFMPDDDTTPSFTINRPPNDRLNRATYLWTINSVDHLQAVVDYLIGTYNGYSLIDYSTGQETAELKLWRPEQLVIDDYYWQQLQSNFDRVNKLLDQLEKYAEPYVKG